ncbi:hypothetical protein LTR92_000860 [Exophiala xenobiotica]|nr:hypothetical protein LTR92_000860 [Exophiala xenobiotica]
MVHESKYQRGMRKRFEVARNQVRSGDIAGALAVCHDLIADVQIPPILRAEVNVCLAVHSDLKEHDAEKPRWISEAKEVLQELWAARLVGHNASYLEWLRNHIQAAEEDVKKQLEEAGVAIEKDQDKVVAKDAEDELGVARDAPDAEEEHTLRLRQQQPQSQIVLSLPQTDKEKGKEKEITITHAKRAQEQNKTQETMEDMSKELKHTVAERDQLRQQLDEQKRLVEDMRKEWDELSLDVGMLRQERTSYEYEQRHERRAQAAIIQSQQQGINQRDQMIHNQQQTIQQMQGTPEYDQQQMIATIQYQQQVIEEQEVMMTEQDREANAMLERRRMTVDHLRQTVDVRNQLINRQKTTIQELRETMSAQLIESQQQTIDQLTQQRDGPPGAQVNALIAALPVEQLPGILERLVARLSQRGRPQR